MQIGLMAVFQKLQDSGLLLRIKNAIYHPSLLATFKGWFVIESESEIVNCLTFLVTRIQIISQNAIQNESVELRSPG